MKKIINLILLTTIIFNLYIFKTNSYASSVNVVADSAILMDVKSGKILYEKNINKKQYPASITKLMTALLAIENGTLDDTLTYSKEAIFSIEPGSSHIAIEVGEQLTLNQALHALLLVSANDAAAGIAEYIDGTIESFAEHMTKRAKELGCKNTNFKNPHGLHNKDHYTTAYDMALIAKEVLKYPLFKDIISTLTYQIPPTNKKTETRYFATQHKMIKQNSGFYYEGCEGGKTGYTDQARHTLVTYAKKDDTELICVILRGVGSNIYTDTQKLFDYGFKNFHTIPFLSKYSVVEKIPVYNNDVDSDKNNKKEKLGYMDVIAKNDFVFVGDKNIKEKNVKKQISLPDILTTPIYKNDEIGEINFVYNGTVLGTVPLIATQTFENINAELKATLQHSTLKSNKNPIITILQTAIIILVILFVLLFTLALYKKYHRKRKKN